MKLKAEISQDKYMLHQNFAFKKQSVVVLVAKFFTVNIEQQEKCRCQNGKNSIDGQIQKYKYLHLTSLPQVEALLAHSKRRITRQLYQHMSNGDLYNFIASETMEQLRLERERN